MIRPSKFKIDNTLYEISISNNINLKILTKSTIQFIMIIDRYFEDLESSLNFLIDDNSQLEIKSLSYKYDNKDILVKITDNQKESYHKIKQANRVKLLNKIISFAINDNYHNKLESKKYINAHRIINSYTVKSLLNEDFKNQNIIIIETILDKLNGIINNNYVMYSFYNDFICSLVKKYNANEEILHIINGHKVVLFLHQEFEKIYFIMINYYNIRKELSNTQLYKKINIIKYENLLVNKYNNNLTEYITNEINIFNGETQESNAQEYYQFIQDVVVETSDFTISTIDDINEPFVLFNN